MRKLMNKMILGISLMLSASLAGVNVSPVSISPITISPVSISSTYISPIHIHNVSISYSSYNPVNVIRTININSVTISPTNISNSTQVRGVYVNYYDPYKILKNSYQNIRISYFNNQTGEFSN